MLDSLTPEQRSSIELDDITDVKDIEIEGLVVAYVRRLYDFFDDQEIYINILRAPDEYDRIWGWNHISLDYDRTDLPTLLKTRTEAESRAFEEAFKILEGRV